jgi:negative regulator of flagellin synthesis FlgM
MEGGGSNLNPLYGVGGTVGYTAVDNAAVSDADGTTKIAAVTVEPGAEAGAVGVVATDQAQVSTAGSLLARALTGSDVRTEKVAALQQAIGAGTYNVSSAAVAGKVIDALTA